MRLQRTMDETHASAWCPHCDRRVLAVRKEDNFHVGNATLAFLTCGLWLPVWALTGLIRAGTKRFRCSRCGTPVSTADPAGTARALVGAVVLVVVLYLVFGR